MPNASHVVENDDEFTAAVANILASHSDDGRAGLRHAYALANTCHGMGERILDLIDAACDRGRPMPAPPSSAVENAGRH